LARYPFMTPLLLIFVKELGQNGVPGQLLLRFAPFLLQCYSYWNVDYSYKNDTNRVSWWWDMTDWWWKVGFMPRAIRHVHPYWQLSSLGVISSYIWVLSLGTARVRILWEHFRNTPFSVLRRPPLVKMSQNDPLLQNVRQFSTFCIVP